MHRPFPIILSSLLFIAAYLQYATAYAANYTIDDTSQQQVTYHPLSVWATQACQHCNILPNASPAMEGTYHEAIWNPGDPQLTATLRFNGTAISVYFTLVDNPDTLSGVITETRVNFTLDDQPPHLFSYIPTKKKNLIYQSLVFTSGDLEDRPHTLLISGPKDSGSGIYVNFDYATYIHNNDTQGVALLPSADSTFSDTAETTISSTYSTSRLMTTISQPPGGAASDMLPRPPEPTTVTIFTTTAVMSNLSLTSVSLNGATQSSAPVAALADPMQHRVGAGTIAGVVIGVLVLLGGSLPLTRYLCWQRKLRRHKVEQDEAVRFYRERLVRGGRSVQ